MQNLEAYVPNFQAEMVDGSLLIHLTHDILEEMGMKNKIHRLRLMKFTSGKSSTEQYFREQPYLKLFKAV